MKVLSMAINIKNMNWDPVIIISFVCLFEVGKEVGLTCLNQSKTFIALNVHIDNGECKPADLYLCNITHVHGRFTYTTNKKLHFNILVNMFGDKTCKECIWIMQVYSCFLYRLLAYRLKMSQVKMS